MSVHPRLTLKEIAEKAGVHQTTVSMALRNRPELAAATRERLQKLAADMGYRPDPALKALRACRSTAPAITSTYSIALITGMDTPYKWRDVDVYVKYFAGARERAAQLGYHIDHFWYDRKTMNKARATAILKARNISGLLITGARLGPTPEIAWENFSCATITRSSLELPITLITDDHLYSVRVAFGRLCALGYKRIGLAMEENCNDHVQGIWSLAFMGAQGMLPPRRRIPPYLPPAFGREGFLAWVKRYSPDVVLTIPPNLRILDWLAEAGLRVPDQIGVASLDCQAPWNGVSGIDQHPKIIGITAVDVIVGLIQRNDLGLQEHPTTVLTQGSWKDGKTTRPQ